MDTYQYLKQYLSSKEIKRIREGKNKHGMKLSRRQCYNIMKGISKNFLFLNLLIEQARHNEGMSNNQSITFNHIFYESQN